MVLADMWNMQGAMFLLIVGGVVLKKMGILKSDALKILTDLVLSYVLPCNIISSFCVGVELSTLKSFPLLILISFCIYLFGYLIGRVLFSRYDEAKRVPMIYASLVSNAAFFGSALMEGLFGATGLIFTTVYTFPGRILMWGIGIPMYSGKTDIKSAIKSVLLHPCMVALYLGVIIMGFRITLPAFITTALSFSGKCTTLLTMTMVGLMVADVKDIKTIIDKDVIYYSLVRTVLIPLVVFGFCRVFNVEEMTTNVCVLLSGMPAATLTAVMAAKYNKDHIFASKLVIVSTIMTLITLPGWCMVLNNF